MDLAKNKFFLLFTAFAAGACMMVLELTASRVLAPSFGSGIYVWGSLIGVIMAALALGYYLGGVMADKSSERILFKNLIACAIIVSIIPAVGDLVAKLSTIGGLILGPIVSTVILFALPMTLLATTSPIVIKHSTNRLSELGLSAGTVYAVSTAGSIIGTFATAFVLIPAAGSRMTLILTAVILFLLGIAGVQKMKYFMVVVFLLPGLLYRLPVEKGVIYQTESEYNVIKVLDEPDYRILKLNLDYGIQSKVGKNDILTGGYWDYHSIGPLLTKTDRILWLGMCVGTSPRQLVHFYNVTVDAVEIDPKVVEVAKEYFGLNESDRIRVHVSDGRDYLRISGAYDIINVDVFSGGFDIPFHMATREFFQEAKDHMTEDGVLMMNTLAIKNDERVSSAVSYTLKQVFPSVFIVKIDENRMLLAFKKEKGIDEVKNSLKAYDPKLSQIVNNTVANVREFNSDEGVILTDDKSNLDELTFEVVSKAYEI